MLPLNLISEFKSRLRTDALRNIFSMLSAEVVAKLSRIVTLVVLAMYLSVPEYGTAMLVLACHDMIRLILRCGAGSQLVQCSENELPELARNAVLMQWGLCGVLAAIQFVGAWGLAWFYQNDLLSQLLQQLAFVYLFYPLVSVRVFLLQRTNKLGYFSFCNGACVTTENLSIAALLYFGHGIEAIVYGKFIYVCLWVFLFLRIPVRLYGVGFDSQVMKRLFHNSTYLFKAEFSRSLRINGDLFLAGKLLSPEVLGIYSFARSASIAVSQALSTAVSSALYPQCCVLARTGASTKQINTIIWVSVMMCLAFVCQAVLAPVYIPLFFDQTWHDAIPSAVLLCLSAIAVYLLDLACCVLRALGHFAAESGVRLGHLVLLLSGLMLFQPREPVQIAAIVLSASAIWMAAIALFYGSDVLHWQQSQKAKSPVPVNS